MEILWKKKMIGLCLLGFLLANCAGRATESTNNITESVVKPDDDTLNIWWSRSYYAEEDEALEAVIAAWQRKTGEDVNFSLLSQDDILKETENALKAGNPPDIVFARADDTLVPHWAWNGQLADVSDVIEPLKDTFSPTALASVNLYNNTTQKRSTYAVPFKQESVYIHYRRELLTEAGLSETDIPKEWDAFWSFWKQAQDNLRANGQDEIYALGFPMSSEATDTHAVFEHVLNAYDVQLLDEDGNLRINPQVRQGLITALDWYTSFYREGYVPQAAENWINSSNNAAFLNQNVLMTINPSLSIPGSQREDEEIYYNEIATLGFPYEPDGERLTPIVTVKQVLLFESSSNQETAKDFLAYFVQPENLGPYLEQSLGRYFPVMPQLTVEPFWNDPSDPHIFTVTQQFQNETRLSYQALNPAYVIVVTESVWGRAIERIIVDGVSPESAADEALNQIQEIFEQWDS